MLIRDDEEWIGGVYAVPLTMLLVLLVMVFVLLVSTIVWTWVLFMIVLNYELVFTAGKCYSLLLALLMSCGERGAVYALFVTILKLFELFIFYVGDFYLIEL